MFLGNIFDVYFDNSFWPMSHSLEMQVGFMVCTASSHQVAIE